MDKQEKKRLEVLAAKIRVDVLKMLEKRGYGHLGGSLSIVEVLSVLYGKQLRYDAKHPSWKKRDMLVLSKGHAGPALYAALANVGFFKKELLYTLNEGGTQLPSHPDRLKTLGVDMTTGSLGQGVSVAAGIATGFRIDKSDRYVYAIVGDGELNEGQCWEAFQYIAHHKLQQCIVIIDENKKQLDGMTTDILNPFCIEEKMRAFGFYTLRVKGDNVEAIEQAIQTCKTVKNQAVCIVLDTVKGQGVSFFEEMKDNHSVKFNNDVMLEKNHEAIETLETFIKEAL
ncbi:MAG: transketolase [Breznakia sp.]